LGVSLLAGFGVVPEDTLAAIEQFPAVGAGPGLERPVMGPMAAFVTELGVQMDRLVLERYRVGLAVTIELGEVTAEAEGPFVSDFSDGFLAAGHTGHRGLRGDERIREKSEARSPGDLHRRGACLFSCAKPFAALRLYHTLTSRCQGVTLKGVGLMGVEFTDAQVRKMEDWNRRYSTQVFYSMGVDDHFRWPMSVPHYRTEDLRRTAMQRLWESDYRP
jgi:hypothetical protein